MDYGEREPTKRDWIAVKVAYDILTAVVLRGEAALWTAVDGLYEARHGQAKNSRHPVSGE